jgi:hypothetical protein
MARPQYRIRRPIGFIPFQANTPVVLDLPRDYDYEALGARITGSIQVTTGATSVRAEAPCQLVPRLEIIADGKNTLFNAPLWFPSMGNYPRALLQNGARVTTPPTAASAATYPVEANAIIDFMTVDGVHPKDSNFRPSGLSLFQLRATFGAPIDIFVPGAGVAVAVAGLGVEIYAVQVVEQPDSAGNYSSPIALKKVSFQNLAVAANNTGQEIRLPAGNFIKSLLVRGEGAVTAGEPSTGVVNNMILQNGIDTRFNLSSGQVRTLNNGDYGFIPAGYYVADFLSKGRADSNLSELWDCTNPAEPKLVINVNGGASNYVNVAITEYIMAGS